MGVLGDSISAATLADLPLPAQCDAGIESCVEKWARSQEHLIYSNKKNLS